MGKNEDPVARAKRQQRHRDRLRDAGLTTVTVKVPIDKTEEIKARAAEMVEAMRIGEKS